MHANLDTYDLMNAGQYKAELAMSRLECCCYTVKLSIAMENVRIFKIQ